MSLLWAVLFVSLVVCVTWIVWAAGKLFGLGLAVAEPLQNKMPRTKSFFRG